jgi:glucose-1-phosphate cytidylyltransferase
MKVVLFCGGFGMRLREYSESIPKPMVKIGYRPILWHVMKYYAHFGHKDFILCLGWKANVIKEFFLGYDECISNDFVMSAGGQNVKLLNSDIDDWNITFVDTGTQASIGQRLKSAEPYLEGEETFLANYTDGLCDVDLNELIRFHQQQAAVATFLSVPPSHSFHTVDADSSGRVQRIQEIGQSETWMNGGYFIFNKEFFNYLGDGEEMVQEPFNRLIAEDRLCTMRYSGFWSCMDTYKELEMLHDMNSKDETPWALWNKDKKSPAREFNGDAALTDEAAEQRTTPK